MEICGRIHQVRVSRAHWSKSEGPTVARALAEQHFRNETYVLGVDSHCHFLRGWDNVAIDMFKRIGNDLAIISAYPPSYNEVCNVIEYFPCRFYCSPLIMDICNGSICRGDLVPRTMMLHVIRGAKHVCSTLHDAIIACYNCE